jgi:sugar-specific transcriptional regulator TrmB
MNEIVKKLGLSRNEAKVYESLLGLGVAKTGAIIQNSGVTSSRVYSSLGRLQKLGLASSFLRNNVRYYRPEPPIQLLAELKEQEKELVELCQTIREKQVQAPDPSRIAVYEGERGYKQAFLRHVSDVPSGGELHIIAYGIVFKTNQDKRKFFKRVDEIMVARKGRAKMIIDKSLEVVMRADRKYRSAYDLRVLPSKYFGAMSINISGKEVLLSAIGDEPIAVALRDPWIIASFESQFKLLWSIAKPLSA